jgi:hypothetical protein
MQGLCSVRIEMGIEHARVDDQITGAGFRVALRLRSEARPIGFMDSVSQDLQCRIVLRR